MVDLIGQYARGTWREKMSLLVIDAFVIIVQVVACSVLTEIQKQQTWTIPSTTPAGVEPEATTPTVDGYEMQSLDFRERNVGRNEDPASEQDPPSQVTSRETTSLLSAGAWDAEGESALVALETVHAGQIVLANLYVWDLIQNNFWDERNRRRGGRV